ncbi:UDP-N-acetyl-D-mannosamine dehydrogenase [Aquibaculum sediminis]|uniref:UDP-N-acetyl-D-mannosamine dehydrogenase n=1 Tax=Aquibaculum sediminis TaxID=3231907 RepID=UPI003454A4B0
MRVFETVSVVGLGYIGLPTAAVMASRGLNVIGVDISSRAVSAINSGRAHFFEPELDALVKKAVDEGRLRAVTQPEPAEAFVIAVPTPVGKDHAPDLSYVEAAAASIAPVLQKGNLIILESTSPVGTTEMLSEKLAGLRRDLTFACAQQQESDVLLAYCPERIIPGHMVVELLENDRIIGGLSPASTEAATALYQTFVQGQLVPTTSRTAEMVKLTENASRDVSIAFANELSKLCDTFGIDVWELIELANHHPRVNILKPGPGVGGHCIAVDPWFIIHAAEGLAPLMHAARQVNDSKPGYVVERVLEMAQPGDTIACLGLAYKADTDDLRESPAVEIIEALAERHEGRVLAVEPNVGTLPPSLEDRGVAQADLSAALSAAQTVVLLVDHRQFKAVSKEVLQGKRVVDTRGIWPRVSTDDIEVQPALRNAS